MAADAHSHPSGRRAALLGALALVVLVAQQPWNERLTGSAAPHGIVSFEVAGTAERAGAMLEQWAAAGETSTAWWLMAIDLGYPHDFLARDNIRTSVTAGWACRAWASAVAVALCWRKRTPKVRRPRSALVAS